MAFDASKALCPHCKQWNSGDMPDTNASVVKSLDGADADNTILLSNVKGGNTVRIQTGPWDPCFGMHYTRERRIGRNGHFIDDGGPVYGLVKTSTTLIGGEPGAGKAGRLTTKILTPYGWSTLGELVLGDLVIDPDGGVAEVLGIYPQGKRDLFRLTTNDGESTECCEQHLWSVWSLNDRKRGKPFRTIPLKDFRHDLRTTPDAKGWDGAKWFLPLTQPVEYTATSRLDVSPYLLGVLLGDAAIGTCAQDIRLTNPDSYVVDKANALLPPGTVFVKSTEVYTWRTRGKALVRLMDSLGLMGKRSWEKSIPDKYFYASPQERLALLHGLMDTDGNCTTRGSAIFNTSSSKLADDVVRLVRDFGGIASITTRANPTYSYKGETLTGRPAHRVYVRLPVNPFSLPRKAERWKPSLLARTIVSVEPSGHAETVCIRVSSKRNLYITDGHIVTHNTTMALQICDGIANTTQREIIYVGAEQAAKEIRDTFDRLRLKNHHLMRIVPLGSDANIAQILLTRRPCAAVFDSLPGLGLDAEEGVAFCKALKGYAVELEAPILVIDHVTKADNFAGLKALQHEVDTLVTLRGEKDEPRELASTKNRHGACVEMTLIMTEWGLRAATKEELEEEEEEEDE
jgi:hypothetical protein